jgi:hypothetical protein
MFQRRDSQGRACASVALLVALSLFTALPARAASCGNDHIAIHDNFTSGNLDAWQMPFPQDWEILQEGNFHYLHMKRSREPGVPRRPLQFALLKGVKVGSFDLNVRLRRSVGSSVIIVFNYVDTMHFYYAHLSHDPGARVSVHNGIFLVNGKPRYRIAGAEAPPSLPDMNWHDVHIERNARTGSIALFLNGSKTPQFSVVDRTFTCGQVGLGSFDETGDFADFQLRSKDAQRFGGQ